MAIHQRSKWWNDIGYIISKINALSINHIHTSSLSGNSKRDSGWPHSSRDKIPCVFPEFSLCYELFPCVFFHKINRWFWVLNISKYIYQYHWNLLNHKKYYVVPCWTKFTSTKECSANFNKGEFWIVTSLTNFVFSPSIWCSYITWESFYHFNIPPWTLLAPGDSSPTRACDVVLLYSFDHYSISRTT